MVRAATALICALVLSGCAGVQGSSRSTGDYAHKAANTAETVRSAVETALFAARLSTDGKITSAALSVTIREAFEDASATVDGFDSIQPPGQQADEIHDDLSELDQAAVESLRDALVQARRGASLRSLIPALESAAKDLEAFDPGHGA